MFSSQTLRKTDFYEFTDAAHFREFHNSRLVEKFLISYGIYRIAFNAYQNVQWQCSPHGACLGGPSIRMPSVPIVSMCCHAEKFVPLQDVNKTQLQERSKFNAPPDLFQSPVRVPTLEVESACNEDSASQVFTDTGKTRKNAGWPMKFDLMI